MPCIFYLIFPSSEFINETQKIGCIATVFWRDYSCKISIQVGGHNSWSCSESISFSCTVKRKIEALSWLFVFCFGIYIIPPQQRAKMYTVGKSTTCCFTQFSVIRKLSANTPRALSMTWPEPSLLYGKRLSDLRSCLNSTKRLDIITIIKSRHGRCVFPGQDTNSMQIHGAMKYS